MIDGAKEFIHEELAIMFRVLRESFGMSQDRAIETVYEVLDKVRTEGKELNVMSYLHIETAPGSAGRVLEKIKDLPAIKQAHVVTGNYDIIATLKTKDIAELREIVTENIHNLGDIYSTTTSLVVV